MLYLIEFPNISPEIFSIDLFGFTLALRWYALAYIAGILLGWRYIVVLVNRPQLWGAPPMTARQVEDLMTWMVVGIILGGRIGFALFYNFAYYSQNIVEILQVWKGGMSFHGGMLGVVIATILFSWRNKLPLLGVGDAIAMAAPIGLLLGRLANFINGELWGRPTDVGWAMIFPDPRAQICPEGWLTLCARHPSQLYEAALEGALLLVIMAFLIWRKGWLKAPGRMIGVFLTGYGAARFFVEFYREPDAQFVSAANPLGHIIRLGEYGITMGQALSMPMIIGGIIFLALSKRQK
ncbi:MAG: prolipoprotein diacylglyceryl transferase [Rhodobacteraceae bacterium]|nr:prolipoprotein diacylglyceryl transferase [Paracoccaceae bacterium]